MVIIFRDLGSKLILFGIWGTLQKVKNELKNITLKEKHSFGLILF